jgi:signal transduction histidine kinase
MRHLVRRHRPDALTVIGAALSLLLVALAVVQYRWLGQVSAADRARLRSDMRRRVESLARDFDREVTRAFFWLGVPEDPHDFPSRYQAWRARAPWPDLVKTVLLAELRDDGSNVVKAYVPAHEAFEHAEWPAGLSPPERTRRPPVPPDAFRGGQLRIAFGLGPVLGDPPILIQPFHHRWNNRTQSSRTNPPFVQMTFILLDADAIRDHILPDLVRRHFGGPDENAFAFQVVDEDHGKVVYSSRSDGPARSDVSVSLLALRPGELGPSERLRALHLGDGLPQSWRRGAERWPVPPGRRGSPALTGVWRLDASYRGASLDAIVAAARLRNMAVSFGILAVLGAAVALLVTSARRLRRLAQRQMAFVATVAHELRTPVAVIGTAAENLADGVVTDPTQVREYGALVRDEGRRLGSLVEQALELARASTRRPGEVVASCDLAQVITRALEDSGPVLRADGFVVDTDVDDDQVEVRGDCESLVRALRNLVENAVRYSGDSRWIKVSATVGPATARVGVEDRGLGLEDDELDALFDPFVRGREAVRRQIHGTGLGLTVVRGVMDAVGGRVEVESAPGRGSTFTLVLPLVSRYRSSLYWDSTGHPAK